MAVTGRPTARITGIHTVGVPVTDQDKALEFYTGTLGLTTRIDVPMGLRHSAESGSARRFAPQRGSGSRWIEVAADGAPTSVALVPAKDSVPAGVETGVRFVTTDADAFHAHLRAAGVDVGEVLRWPGVPPMFALRDQDGNGMEIVQQS
jgi:lactoylglutathione lyase